MNAPTLPRLLLTVQGSLLERLPGDLIGVISQKILEIQKIKEVEEISADIFGFTYGHRWVIRELALDDKASEKRIFTSLILNRDISIANVHKLIMHLLPAIEIEIKFGEFDGHLKLYSYDENVQSKMLEISAVAGKIKVRDRSEIVNFLHMGDCICCEQTNAYANFIPRQMSRDIKCQREKQFVAAKELFQGLPLDFFFNNK
jgi:hypothetical protein